MFIFYQLSTVVDSDWRFNNLCGSHLQRQGDWGQQPECNNIDWRDTTHSDSEDELADRLTKCQSLSTTTILF